MRDNTPLLHRRIVVEHLIELRAHHHDSMLCLRPTIVVVVVVRLAGGGGCVVSLCWLVVMKGGVDVPDVLDFGRR